MSPWQRTPSGGSAADLKARVVAAWEQTPDPMVELPPIVLDTRAPHPPGWAVWRVGSLAGPAVASPDLTPLGPVPEQVARRYFERVLSTARGHCHRCGAAASVSVDPTSSPAAWRLLEVSVDLVHAVGCPCRFEEADRPYLDPRAFERTD